MALKDRLIDKITVGDFISTLLFSRNQAHVFHWQTLSVAQHLCLGTYYTEIVELVDTLVETYQGTNGVIKVFSNNDKYIYGELDIPAYFKELLAFVTANRTIIGEDTDLQNIVDEIVSLIKNTLDRLRRD